MRKEGMMAQMMIEALSCSCKKITGSVMEVVKLPISRILVAAQMMRQENKITKTRDENVIRTFALRVTSMRTS
jgi:hypothetical protein